MLSAVFMRVFKNRDLHFKQIRAFPAAVAETYTPRDGVRRISTNSRSVLHALYRKRISTVCLMVRNVQIRYGTGEAIKENETLTIYFHLET